MKNFLIAVVLAIILVNCFGSLMSDWWGVHLVVADDLLSPFENLLAFSALAVVFVFVGFIVAVSIAGALFIGVAAAVLSVVALGVTALWPILLIAAVLYLVKRNKQPYASAGS